MRSYQWWRKQKKRVQKKYTLLCGRYLSPRELKIWYRNWCKKEMKIIIDIPDEAYKTLLEEQRIPTGLDYEYLIMHGTPLPKGHGRIGDLDALEQEMINGIKAGNYENGYEDYSNINSVDDCVELVRFADTIIETDKEGKTK